MREVSIYSGWDFFMKLHKLYIDGDAQLIENESKLDLTNFAKNWSTYSRCYDIKFVLNNTPTIEMHIKVYDGNNMDGSREGLRWQAKWHLKTFDILKDDDIKRAIDSKFTQIAQEQYAFEEAQKEKDAIKAIENRWLTMSHKVEK